MRELSRKWMTGKYEHEHSERVRVERREETSGSKGTWEPIKGIYKAEHFDWEATQNYIKWAMEPGRRHLWVRYNHKNKRVEIKHHKDIEDNLHTNSWSLVHKSSGLVPDSAGGDAPPAANGGTALGAESKGSGGRVGKVKGAAAGKGAGNSSREGV